MSSTLAIVLSFHPSKYIVRNIETLLMEVSHVVVVDNESSEDSKRILSYFSKERVTCIFNATNNGVAKGFNQGIKWGLEKNFDYFLLMDQDSRPVPNMVMKLKVVLESHLQQQRQLVLVGPQHEDYIRKLTTITENVDPTPLLITSGSLMSKGVIDVVGLYDERLFIDHVDHDYCLRLKKMGGQCLKVNSAILLHKFGEARVKKIFGKTFFLQEYSPFRRYYMMRNRIILYKRYGMFKEKWFWLDLKNALKDFVKLVVFEKQKRAKIFAIFRGVFDGIFWVDA